MYICKCTNLTSGFKNVTVLNPGIEVPCEDETGLQLWGPDPVHPLPEGYRPDSRFAPEGVGPDQREEEEEDPGWTGAGL